MMWSRANHIWEPAEINFQLFARTLEGRRHVLIWVPPKADLEIRIWVQAVYLGGDPRKHSEGIGEGDRGVKTISKCCIAE